jgi:hypothetical protein
VGSRLIGDAMRMRLIVQKQNPSVILVRLGTGHSPDWSELTDARLKRADGVGTVGFVWRIRLACRLLTGGGRKRGRVGSLGSGASAGG